MLLLLPSEPAAPEHQLFNLSFSLHVKQQRQETPHHYRPTLEASMTKLCATFAMKPSTWTPKSLQHKES